VVGRKDAANLSLVEMGKNFDVLREGSEVSFIRIRRERSTRTARM
jgi:hypothetical protein